MVNLLKSILKVFRAPKKEGNFERRIKYGGKKPSTSYKFPSHMRKGNISKSVQPESVDIFEKLKHEHRQANYEQEYVKAVKKQRELFLKAKPSNTQFVNDSITPSSQRPQNVHRSSSNNPQNSPKLQPPKKGKKIKESSTIGLSLQNPSITFFDAPKVKATPSQEQTDEQINRVKTALSSKSSLLGSRNVLVDYSQAILLQTILEGLKDLQDIEARLPHKHIFQ